MKKGQKFAVALSLALAVGMTGLWISAQAAPVAAAPTRIPAGAYAPTQPIPYSHKLHAGDLKIPCEFCHTYARRSRSAGIPALEQCMQCHSIIATDRENIKKVAAAYDSKQPIEWAKVHDLPDFVFFSHKRHVKAGFACQECHGPVETMEIVYRKAPLTMGWCVTCHQQNLDKGASVDCLTCHK